MEYYKNLDLKDIKYFCEIDLIDKLEQWKDVFTYEGLYMISDLGRVKSLSRSMFNGSGYFISKEKIIKLQISNIGYPTCYLSKNGKVTSKKSHILLTKSFLNHNPDKSIKIVVDHVDNDKKNNKLNNLQIITQRINATKDRNIKKTSRYIGVDFNKARSIWRSHIYINKKQIYLGSFEKEEDAKNAYQKKLKEYEDSIS